MSVGIAWRLCAAAEVAALPQPAPSNLPIPKSSLRGACDRERHASNIRPRSPDRRTVPEPSCIATDHQKDGQDHLVRPVFLYGPVKQVVSSLDPLNLDRADHDSPADIGQPVAGFQALYEESDACLFLNRRASSRDAEEERIFNDAREIDHRVHAL